MIFHGVLSNTKVDEADFCTGSVTAFGTLLHGHTCTWVLRFLFTPIPKNIPMLSNCIVPWSNIQFTVGASTPQR